MRAFVPGLLLGIACGFGLSPTFVDRDSPAPREDPAVRAAAQERVGELDG